MLHWFSLLLRLKAKLFFAGLDQWTDTTHREITQMLKLQEKEEEIHGWQHRKEGGLLFHCYLLQKLKFISMRLQVRVFYRRV